MSMPQLVHATSSHLSPLMRSIAYSQFLWPRRNFSDDQSFFHEARLLRDRFLQRGYSKKCLRKTFNRATIKVRRDLLYQQKQPSLSQTVKFITKYVTEHKRIWNLLEKHRPILTLNKKITKYIKEHPEITFRKTKSLSDHLFQSHYGGLSRGGPMPMCEII